MSDRDTNRAIAAIAGIAILAGPRRTRPLAGFLYGLTLSRAHGAGRDRLERTIARLFDERRSVGAQVEATEAARARLGAELADAIDRIDTLEQCFGGDPAKWLEDGRRERDRHAAMPDADDDCGGGGS